MLASFHYVQDGAKGMQAPIGGRPLVEALVVSEPRMRLLTQCMASKPTYIRLSH